MLKQHPVLDAVLSGRKDDLECWVEVLGSGELRHLVYIAAGLMGRAQEVPEEGFTVACTELAALLWLSRMPDASLALPNHHNRAYYIVPFFGLQVTENVRIARDMTLVPYKEIKPYIDDEDVRRLAPDIVSYHSPDILGAIRKPALWKPVLQSHGSMDTSLPPVPRRFFDDADLMLKLLSITHAAPILPLGEMGLCIQQPAAQLLGHHRYYPGINWMSARPSIHTAAQPLPVEADAFERAPNAFKRRNAQRFKDYAPIIARLAESQARTGPFGFQDRILDVAIALERMYELDPGEISFKLRARAACFLADSTEQRKRIFRQIRDFYDLRSALVHSRRKSKKSRKLLTPQHMTETFDTGFALARETLMKLLNQGPPRSWDELVISIPDSPMTS